MANRHYYAGHSYMGVNFTFDSPCWTAYAFDTKSERDQYVEDNEYRDGNRVTEIIDRKIAYKIAGVNTYNLPHICKDDNRLEAY